MRITALALDHLDLDLTGDALDQRLQILDIFSISKDDPRWLAIVTGQESMLVARCSPRTVREGGGYMRVQITTEFLSPYLERLATLTGGSLDSLDLTSLFQPTHTYIMESCVYAKGTTTATMVVIAYPYAGIPLATDEERLEKASRNAKRYLEDMLGETPLRPEFLPLDNGFYRPNPDYGKAPLPPRACPNNERVWQAVFGTWATQSARPAQQAILARLSRYGGQQEVHPTLHDYRGIYLDNYATLMPWEEFAQA